MRPAGMIVHASNLSRLETPQFRNIEVVARFAGNTLIVFES